MTHALVLPLLADLGPAELLIIFGIIVLLFGASKLPELARGSGRALRIFKAETKGLHDDDEAAAGTATPAQREVEARQREAEELREAEQRVADLKARAARPDEPGTGTTPR